MKNRNLTAKMNKALALLLAALMLIGLLAACGGAQSEGSTAASEPRHLNYGLSNAWDSLMPYNSVSGSNYSRIVYDKIYDRLAYVQADGTCLPRAAKSWESENDGRTIVFTLDLKAAFHDGTPVTAQHWVETIQMMTNPTCPTLGRASFADLVGTDENGARLAGEEVGAEVIVANKLALHFKNPVDPEEFLIAKNREFYVLPTHLMQDTAPADIMDMDLWKKPIGSGPMKFVSEISGSSITLETNQDYHLGAAGFETMTMTVIDKSNQLTALMSGDLDYYAFGNSISEENSTIAKDADFTVLKGDVPTTFYELMLNNESIAQTELRQAISLALDRNALCEQNSGTLGTPTMSSILPGTDYAVARKLNAEAVSRKVTQAASLVEKHYDGTSFTLACTSQRASLAALIQQNLQEAGFSVEIQTVDSATLFSGMYDGEYDMAIASHTPNPLPLWFVESRFREDNNLFRVPDVAPYLNLITGINETQPDEDVFPGLKWAMIDGLEMLLAEEMPFVPLWFTTPLYVQSKTVSGIDYPASSFSNENVWEWRMY